MDAYAKYLIEMFKQHDFNRIVIKNTLVNSNGKAIWGEDSSKEPCSKRCIIGGDNGSYTYFVSHSRRIFGDAVFFNRDWQTIDDEKYKIDDLVKCMQPSISELLSSLFIQMMYMTNSRPLFIYGDMLFKKNSAPEHFITADINMM